MLCAKQHPLIGKITATVIVYVKIFNAYIPQKHFKIWSANSYTHTLNKPTKVTSLPTLSDGAFKVLFLACGAVSIISVN